MARVQSEAEIESIAERVPVMKNENEKLDLLLEKNAAEQLAGVDWNQLGAAISDRLNRAEKRKHSIWAGPIVFKAAAGIAAAAAIVFITLVVKTETPAAVGPGSAAVHLVTAESTASVQIGARKMGTAVVDTAGDGRNVAICEVEIIDMNGDFHQRRRATWTIITMPAPIAAENGTGRDERDLLCLL